MLPEAEVLAQTEVLLAWDVPQGVIARMPQLHWIQAPTGGVENWLARSDLPPQLVLTCARGIHRVQMPENILAAIFHVTKGLSVFEQQQKRHEWKRPPLNLLAGKTLGILGLGAIGGELARKAAALEVRVIGSKRIPAAVPFVEAVYGADQIDLVLGQSDFVVLLLPQTSETENLINSARLTKMKRSAWLLNFGRGQLVIDQELIDAVQAGRIAGAVLDAFRTEPLPQDHPFWSTPNIIVLPHVAGRHPEKNRILADLLIQNMQRYLAGQTMYGVVDRSVGY